MTLNTLMGIEGVLATAKDLELPATLQAVALPPTASPKTVACKGALLEALAK